MFKKIKGRKEIAAQSSHPCISSLVKRRQIKTPKELITHVGQMNPMSTPQTKYRKQNGVKIDRSFKELPIERLRWLHIC